jgi:hypothetical protein
VNSLGWAMYSALEFVVCAVIHREGPECAAWSRTLMGERQFTSQQQCPLQRSPTCSPYLLHSFPICRAACQPATCNTLAANGPNQPAHNTRLGRAASHSRAAVLTQQAHPLTPSRRQLTRAPHVAPQHGTPSSSYGDASSSSAPASGLDGIFADIRSKPKAAPKRRPSGDEEDGADPTAPMLSRWGMRR